MPKVKKNYLKKIITQNDAIEVIKDTAKGFLFFAIIQTIFSFLLGFALLFDAVVYVICCYFLYKYNSRIAAVVLLFLVILETGITFANKFGIMNNGGTNIILMIIALGAAIRVVEATFKLNGKLGLPKDSPLDLNPKSETLTPEMADMKALYNKGVLAEIEDRIGEAKEYYQKVLDINLPGTEYNVARARLDSLMNEK